MVNNFIFVSVRSRRLCADFVVREMRRRPARCTRISESGFCSARHLGLEGQPREPRRPMCSNFSIYNK